jgi:A/G-specific adenine glycosylase
LSVQPGGPPPMDARRAVLDWYRSRRRAYPWRSGRSDPYRVLVSEVMLQQTQVARVVPAFPDFLRRFPTVRSLAAAPRREVLQAWSGLGYNRRAVALSEAARLLVRNHEARVPSDPEALRKLPGVGPYTAAAVASIAFRIPVPALDTNVARVVARARFAAEPAEVRRNAIAVAAAVWLDRSDPGAWNQALMDLGREVCRSVPRCAACPLSDACRFRAEGREGRPAKRLRPPFQGSMRRVRGAIIVALRARSSASVEMLAKRLGESGERVAEAIRTLARDGLVHASAAAMTGQPGGRVRLPTD